ncbi:hypothetical protein MMC17_006806 [Xylographa soralifera]|nr:hypothetical protein [Xylographa soralifera]
MEFDPTEDISFPQGTETITITFHGQNPITKHPILISYHLKVPADYVRVKFLKTRDPRGRHPRQRNSQCTSLANTSSSLARLNNITLGALFSDLRYDVSYQQVEHIRIEPASTGSSESALITPTAALPSATTSANLTESIGSAPLRVSNAACDKPDGIAASDQNAQSLQCKPRGETRAKRHPKNFGGGSTVSVVIPSTPSVPKSTYPRTRSQSRNPHSDASPCCFNDVSQSGLSCSSNRNSDRPSSPPPSPPSSHIHKDSSIYDACPVCKEPGELFRIKGQGFVWCDKHCNQIPVLRSSDSKDSDVRRSRDDQRIPEKLVPKSKAPAVTTATTQSSSGKRLKGRGNGKTSKKRDCSPVESKRKRRHVTPDEDSSSEST